MTGAVEWHDWSCLVRVVAEQDVLDRAALEVRSVMQDVDAAASRFRADSDLSRCNERAGLMTPVSALFVELVATALEAAAQTDGASDPTIGAHLVALGYDGDIRDVRSRRHAVSVPTRSAPDRLPAWHSVRVEPELRLVGVPRGLALDLGATAKAWTADAAARRVHRLVRSPVLVEIGGDIAVAGAESDPFAVKVAERHGQPGEIVDMWHGGLTTSTTVVRRWQAGRHTVHHIVDPATGKEVRGLWRTATVWAPTAVMANAASTAAIVMNDRSIRWLKENAPAARLVDVDGFVRYLDGWPVSVEAA